MCDMDDAIRTAIEAGYSVADITEAAIRVKATISKELAEAQMDAACEAALQHLPREAGVVPPAVVLQYIKAFLHNRNTAHWKGWITVVARINDAMRQLEVEYGKL